ncbi:LysE family translocator [Methylobacterium sp. J-068]|uniref:LysE family translocator n=1 Tax=Methylobacterium sp. J-068 TaxID=2836649 RepID=UPI001FBAE7A0|nr:LysE family translocator [Methylobacterium sp. J-068]MCJ2035928.1 LysE family translocator [Methylobacterium sp. J-068]
MTFHTWWLFLGAVFALSGTPGPNMLHILARSVRVGLRRSGAAMAGCLSAVILVLLASAAGLSAVLLASPVLFDVLRYAGVAYLLVLGIRAWRGDEASITVEGGAGPAPLSLRRLYRDGLLIGLSNPKLLLFASAFLPQFVDPARPQGPQFAILVATFAGAELFWYGVYALGGRKLAAALTRPALKRAFDRLTGAIFVGFGAMLLGAR